MPGLLPHYHSYVLQKHWSQLLEPEPTLSMTLHERGHAVPGNLSDQRCTHVGYMQKLTEGGGGGHVLPDSSSLTSFRHFGLFSPLVSLFSLSQCRGGGPLSVRNTTVNTILLANV